VTTKTIDITEDVNKKIDEIYKKQGIHKEGFIDAILRLSLWDDAKVSQAVMIVKAYGLQGATKIESMG
jgi:hypothetical protein